MTPNKYELDNDIYGILSKEIEVDTDVNEDANRERLLDDALDTFLEVQNQQST
ncbi:hypothetical protein [Paenibacillus silviterrae]|uniref:hypothetical protein n=1 Tax=Paenibacillus silviterrae TaxID=3242194 RepID=UPI002543231A|nr:hypothetical protein [Paenibacillus chinjuensis]